MGSRDKHRYDDKLIGLHARRLMLASIVTAFLVVILGGAFGAMKFKQYVSEAPKFDTTKLQVSVPSTILADGKVLTKIGDENRTELAHKNIPQSFKDALLSTEDSRFYQHHGFDLIRISKSAIMTILSKLHLGGSLQGGSTLTQQLVKLSFLDQTDLSLRRKAQEAYLAWTVEKNYTKEQILTMYVNKVFMGANSLYGVGTASEYYYGKPLHKLTIPQQAYLAGIPNDPNNLNVYKNPEYSKQRRDIVLLSMYNQGKLSKKQYENYIKVPITDGVVPEKNTMSNFDVDPQYYPFVKNVIEEAKELVGESKLLNGGLVINTTLDADKQIFANSVMNTNNYVAYPATDMLVSYVVLDTKTGRVIAEAGGNRTTKYTWGGYDYATDIRRQAGSTMKPILAYAPAIEKLGYGTGTIVDDTPYKYKSGQDLYDWDRRYMGKIDMKKALASSRNIPAVRLLNEVGFSNAYGFANKLGFGYKPDQYVESGVIGGVSNASPLKMAQAYAAFGNGGVYNKAHFITDITAPDGTTLWQEEEGNKVMGSGTAYMITDMLRAVYDAPYGTAYGRKPAGMDIAGKSGTTNYTDDEYAKYGFNPNVTYVPDSWFVAYNSNYTIAVWTGYNDRNKGITEAQEVTAQNVIKVLFSKYSQTASDPSGTIAMPDSVYSKGGFLESTGE